MKQALPSEWPADRIGLMQTFVTIVEAGSLSAAAAQLGTTQPTVSRRLQALERSLGRALLQRSTHTMRLTADGQRCFERAKELLATWAAFDAELRGVEEEPEGTLRVLVPHAFGQRQLVAPLAGYLRRHPNVAVDWLLRDGTPNFIAEGIDCAIQVGEVSDPSVVAIRLTEIPRIVVASPELLGDAAAALAQDGAHASQLAGLPWLALRTYYRSEITLTQAHSGEACTLPLRPRLATDSLYALHSAALLGLGVCVASAWLLGDDLREGRLLQLAPQWQAAPLPMYLVVPATRFQPARVRRFVEAIRDSLPQLMGQVAGG
jgi:DNA-binding transcriptional LysR family regulator